MFESLTATGTVAVASQFVTAVQVPALVVGGLAIALGLTGWVIRKLGRAAR